MKKAKLLTGIILLLISLTGLQAQNYCLDFDGTNDLVQSVNIGAISEKTISAWVKLDNITQTGVGIVSIEQFFNNSNDNFDAIVYNENGHGWGFGSHMWARTAWSDVFETTANQWVHIAATYEDNSFKMYRNGELILTTTSFQAFDFTAANTRIYAGVRCWSNSGFFNGQIDEVRVWNKVRTQAEIKADMHRELIGNESGLVAYYKMSDGSGTSLTDNSTNSFTASIVGGAVWVQSGPLHITDHTPANNALDIASNSNISITFNQNIDGTTLDATSFNVNGSISGEHAGGFSGEGTQTITFDPTVDFEPGEIVSVALTTSIQSTVGTPLSAPYVFQFFVEVPNITYAQFFNTGQALGNYASASVSLADLDGDNDLDAFVANWNQPNRVWLNDGNGNFSDSNQELGGNAGSAVVCLGDLDSDGDIDAFIGNGGQGGANGPNKVWLNDGNGNFTDSGQNLGNSGTEGLALADLDGDGDLDAFAANYNNQANKVWLNDGAGNFSDSGQNLGNLISNFIALGDLDNDGDVDAYIGNIGAPDEVWLNDGNGNFTNSNQTLYSGANGWELYNLGDVDGDGDLDVVLPKGGVWLNDGNGNLTDSGQTVGAGYGIALNDLDGDGDLDAFYSLTADNKSVWLNDGNGIFTHSGQLFTTGNAYVPALGDLDGDDDIDCFSGNQHNPNQVWLNQILDFGDAPDPTYPTLNASTGASHLLGSTVYLGTGVDAETDGQQSADANGDDTGVANPVIGTLTNNDDEDGVTFTSALIQGTTATVDVTANANCTLSAWVDFDGNGSWADLSEDIFPGGQALSAGVNNLSFAVPAGAVTGATYARFRVTTDGVVTYTGQASDGEVEDYQVTIVSNTDSDGDGILDYLETGDRDGDNIPDKDDYDPSGWIYWENTGELVTGGTISVTPSANVTIVEDGSDGYYQFFVSVSGDYTLSYTPPANLVLSTTCTAEQSTLDIEPTDPNPYLVGQGSKDGTNNQITPYDCINNPYYFEFHLELGDPVIINNNIPLEANPTIITLSSFDAVADGDGIVIRWITETEPNNAGFNLYRSHEESGEYVKLNPSLIQAQGTATTGASYSYTDNPEQAGSWYYKLEDVSLSGESHFHGPVSIVLTDVEINNYTIPEEYSLNQNYPNPFNPETSIEYGLPIAGKVTISIYDINGKLVRNLINEWQSAGNHSSEWDGRDNNGAKVSSGVYFYHFKAGSHVNGTGFSQTKKMILMK